MKLWMKAMVLCAVAMMAATGARTQEPEQDAEGCKDSPLVSR